MNILAIVFLILGILTTLIIAIVAISEHDSRVLWFSFLSLPFFFVMVLSNWPNPTNTDVKSGKAIYVEETHLCLDQNGDTVYNYKTYHVEWLPEWKWGRKH